MTFGEPFEMVEPVLYAIRGDGKTWEVSFEGKEVILNRSKKKIKYGSSEK